MNAQANETKELETKELNWFGSTNKTREQTKQMNKDNSDGDVGRVTKELLRGGTLGATVLWEDKNRRTHGQANEWMNKQNELAKWHEMLKFKI